MSDSSQLLFTFILQYTIIIILFITFIFKFLLESKWNFNYNKLSSCKLMTLITVFTDNQFINFVFNYLLNF